MAIPSVPSTIGDRLALLAMNSHDGRSNIMVFFPKEAKVGLTPIKEYLRAMKDNDATRGILVCQEGITPFAKQALSEGGELRTETIED